MKTHKKNRIDWDSVKVYVFIQGRLLYITVKDYRELTIGLNNAKNHNEWDEIAKKFRRGRKVLDYEIGVLINPFFNKE